MSYCDLSGLTTTQNLTFASFKASKCSNTTRDYAISANPKK